MAWQRLPVQQPSQPLTSNLVGLNVATYPVPGGHLVVQIKYPGRNLLVDTWRMACVDQTRFSQVKSLPFATLFFVPQPHEPVTFWSHNQVHLDDDDVFFNRPLADAVHAESWKRAPHYAAIREVTLPPDLIPQLQALLAQFQDPAQISAARD